MGRLFLAQDIEMARTALRQGCGGGLQTASLLSGVSLWIGKIAKNGQIGLESPFF